MSDWLDKLEDPHMDSEWHLYIPKLLAEVRAARAWLREEEYDRAPCRACDMDDPDEGCTCTRKPTAPAKYDVYRRLVSQHDAEDK